MILGFPAPSWSCLPRLLIAQGLQLHAAARIARHFGVRGARSSALRFLAIGTWWLLLPVIGGLLLGALGAMMPLGWFGVLIAASLIPRGPRQRHAETDPSELGRRRRAVQNPGLPRPARLLLVFILAYGVLSVAWHGATRIGHGPEGWDVWTYHLSFPLEWVTSGELRNELQHYGDLSPPFYPIDAGLVAWSILAGAGSDLLARFAQAPFLATALTAFVSIPVALGLPPWSGLVAGGIFLSLPMVNGMTVLAMNDLSLASALVIALAWLLIWNRQGGLRLAAMAGLSTGLFVGIKSSALLYGLLLIPLVAAGVLRGRKRPASLGVFLGSSLLTGGFSYLRNWIITGNPLFPIHFELFGRRLAEGWFALGRLMRTDFHRLPLRPVLAGELAIKELGWQYLLLLAAYGLGIGLLVVRWLVGAGSFSMLPRRGTASEHRTDGVGRFRGTQLWLLAAPILAYGVFLRLPYRYHPRFYLPAVALLCCGVGLAAAHFPRAAIGLLGGMAGGIALNAATGNAIIASWAWTMVPAAVIAGLADRLPRPSPPRIPARFLAALGLGLLTLAVVSSGSLIERYRAHRWEQIEGDLGEVARWISAATRNEPLRIAYAGFNAPYLLRGAALANRVFFAPRNRRGERYYGFGHRLVLPGKPKDEEAWLANLRRLSVDLLVTSRHDNPQFTVEEEWARDRFKLVFSTERYHVRAVSERGWRAALW
jgi:hypothetical protein